jgi:hypothetical protein
MPIKQCLSLTLAILGWSGLFLQYVSVFGNSITPTFEKIAGFLTYFTVLTDFSTALYFTAQLFKNNHSSNGKLTALTVFLIIAGLLAPNILHCLIPILAIIYWALYENKFRVDYSQVPRWLLYPGIYLLYLIILRKAPGVRPYDFFNSITPALSNSLIYSLVLLSGATLIAFLLIFLGRLISVLS